MITQETSYYYNQFSRADK